MATLFDHWTKHYEAYELLQSEQTERAIAAFTEAIALTRESWWEKFAEWDFRYRSEAHRKLGMVREAEDDLAEAQRLAEEDWGTGMWTTRPAAMSFYSGYSLLLNDKDYVRALVAFDDAVLADPDSEEYLRFRSWTSRELGRAVQPEPEIGITRPIDLDTDE